MENMETITPGRIEHTGDFQPSNINPETNLLNVVPTFPMGSTNHLKPTHVHDTTSKLLQQGICHTCPNMKTSQFAPISV